MVDVIVVGGGPAGLSAALVLGRALRQVLLVDEGSGRNAPATAVHGYLGHDETSPADLRAIGRRQLRQYPSVVVRNERASAVEAGDGGVSVAFPDGSTESARKVLLATGIVDQLPDIEGLAPLWGTTVVHCAYCHGWELRDQPLAALILKPDDVTSALQLTNLSDDVVVCLHGMSDLPAEQRAMLDRAEPPVHLAPIVRVEAEGGRLRRLVFADGTTLERAGLFLHPSSRQATPFARDLGCRLLEDDSVEVDELCKTGVPNVYAAGDMACRRSMSAAGQQVAMAVAEGAVAAISIDQELVSEDFG